jgi:hypothetical protein
VSGGPIFSDEEAGGLVGVITDASRVYENELRGLVGRVLLEPSVLHAGETARAEVDVNHELGKAEEILTGQIESGRQRDPWAYCDLATVRLLRGTPDALATVQKLLDLRPPRFVYEITLDTLEPLAQATADIRPDLAAAVTELSRATEYAT